MESKSHSDDRNLFLVNWFTTIPDGLTPCLNDFYELKRKLTTCYKKFGKWANFVAVDYYSKGKNGGAFKTVQWLNAKLTGKFFVLTALFILAIFCCDFRRPKHIMYIFKKNLHLELMQSVQRHTLV